MVNDFTIYIYVFVPDFLFVIELFTKISKFFLHPPFLIGKNKLVNNKKFSKKKKGGGGKLLYVDVMGWGKVFFMYRKRTCVKNIL